MDTEKQDDLGKLIKIGLPILILGALVFVFFINRDYFFKKDGVVMKGASSRQDLSKKNSDFAKAESLLRNNPSEALISYKEALGNASSQEDSDSISFRIALATYRSGQLSEGINLFKKLVSSKDVSNVTKAYSIQFFVQEYFATNSQSLFDLIFSDDPYKSFLKDNNKEGAIRELVEYGKSLLPLPLLTLRSADYKAKDLIIFKNESDITKETLLSGISNDLNMAEAGIEALRGTPNIDQLPVIYNRKMVLFTNLKRAGYIMGDPADSYEKGVSFSNLYNDKETLMFLHLNYAIYLLIENSEANEEKIRSILKNIVEEKDRDLNVFQYLKNKASSNKNTDEFVKFIMVLVDVDESFKDLLTTLGWKF